MPLPWGAASISITLLVSLCTPSSRRACGPAIPERIARGERREAVRGRGCGAEVAPGRVPPLRRPRSGQGRGPRARPPAAGIPFPGRRGGAGTPLTRPRGCSQPGVVPRGRLPPTRAAAMGNTTSERVSGERHGAKAARAEGGGHGPGKEHKIMVGSTDDPSVFSLPDSKVR